MIELVVTIWAALTLLAIVCGLIGGLFNLLTTPPEKSPTELRWEAEREARHRERMEGPGMLDGFAYGVGRIIRALVRRRRHVRRTAH